MSKWKYCGTSFKRRAQSENGLRAEELIERKGLEMLDAARRLRAPLSVFARNEILDIVQEPDDEFKRMFGAMVSNFMAGHGLKPQGFQDLTNSVWKRVSCFVSIDQVAAGGAQPPAKVLHTPSTSDACDCDRLHSMLRELTQNVALLSRHMGLELHAAAGA